MCDQHIRDDDNSYKELEFDRHTILDLTILILWHVVLNMDL